MGRLLVSSVLTALILATAQHSGDQPGVASRIGSLRTTAAMHHQINQAVATLSTSVVPGQSFTSWTNGENFWSPRNLMIVLLKLHDLRRG